MKRQFAIILALFVTITSFGQEIKQKLSPFRKVIVSPKISLTLIPGDEESVRIEYIGVDEDEIIIEENNRDLHIYLRDAKIVDKGERLNSGVRKEKYRYATVKAYVTFRQLKGIETRGEENVVCEGQIITDKLKIKAYGEAQVKLAYVRTKRLAVNLYGANSLKIAEGETDHQKYALYGENKVETSGLKSFTTRTTIYGEGRVSLFASDEVRLNSFGEPDLFISGSPIISKGIMIGHTNIRRN